MYEKGTKRELTTASSLTPNLIPYMGDHIGQSMGQQKPFK